MGWSLANIRINLTCQKILEWLSYLMLKTELSYLHLSGQNTGMWRTDGQTDRISLAIIPVYVASNADALYKLHTSMNWNPFVVRCANHSLANENAAWFSAIRRYTLHRHSVTLSVDATDLSSWPRLWAVGSVVCLLADAVRFLVPA